MPGTPIRVESSVIAEGDDLELDSWLAADGSEVESEQLVAEVSTAKAIVEVTAPVGGALRQSLTVGALFGPEEAIGFVDHE
jgi:pyruvate/2-oxoglutarate dehydrogenase complex dihydrolipoamide acyltransferase (E2) component